MKRPILPARLIWWRKRPVFSRAVALLAMLVMPLLWWWDFATLGFEEANEQFTGTYRDAFLLLVAKSG